MTSSESRITGVLNLSDKLKACTVRVKDSCTEAGERTIAGWSPWVPQRACITSPWAVAVGMPVLGPHLWILTTTQGTSAITAKPKFSCFKEKPGPLVAVRDFKPAREAPITAAMLDISSSI